LIDLEIYGSDSIFYKNRWMSAFASDAGESVISLDSIRDCVAHPPAWEQSGLLTAGCDFAAGGGNLCVLALARGNKTELDQAHWTWSHANTNHSAGKFVTLFRELKLQSHQIFADGDGLGRGFVDNLEECDFYVREMHNGARARDDKRYASIVAEQWDQLATLIVKRRIILPDCEELFAQLSNRRREYSIKEGLVKIKLESKQDMRARNVSSPDLADACVLALMNGWGSLPGNLNPEGNKRLHEELQECNRMMPRNPFGTGHIRF
jgi:phage terminase large subunit